MKPLIFILFVVTIPFINCSFINVYPKIKTHHYVNDNYAEDVGEPLYLTPLIESGKIDYARSLANVSHPELEWLTSYSGYFTVDKKFNSNMFFWFFPAAHNWETSPVLIWLQGGPGASSLFALFTENGPIYINKNNNLKPRKYSWHLNHNIIYFDNPVGTGFSFTDKDEGYSKNENEVAINLYSSLMQFFKLFPELQKNPFYVTGESYAGKYVPSISYYIHRMNMKHKNSDTFKINLKGLAIGNGLSDPLHQLKYSDYLYQLGLIDLNGQKMFADYEEQGRIFIEKNDFKSAFEIFDKLIDGDQQSYGSLFKNLSGYDMYFNYLKTKDDDSDKRMSNFVQNSISRKSIHVGNNTFHGLDGENKVELNLIPDIMQSVAPMVSELLSYYRVVIYNGQLDIIVAYPLTISYLQKLKFSGAEDYKTAPRYIWRVGDDIAGYAKEAGNLTEVLVRNAGHMVPSDQPKWALDMLLRLTKSKSYSPSYIG